MDKAQKFIGTLLNTCTIVRYVIAGGIASLSNFVTLYVLVQFLGVWYLLASIISFCVGIVTGYILHKFFAFRDKGEGNMIHQFMFFAGYQIVMLGVNTLLMYIAVDIIGIWYLLSQIITTTLIATINFIVFKKYIFKNKF
jgi:putative flippase GtrA